MMKTVNMGEIDGKQLPETCFMHEKTCFIVEKQVLNSHKTMSFTVSKELLIGGIKRDVVKQKAETEKYVFRGKERENCSDFGEGDAP